MGIKFQTDSSEEYSEIQMHIGFHVNDAKTQQELFGYYGCKSHIWSLLQT